MRKNLLRDKRAEDEAKIYRESLSVHKVLDKELGFDKQAIEVFTRSLNIKKKSCNSYCNKSKERD